MVQTLEEIDEAELAVFKKRIKKLKEFSGKGTELITQYIPADADRGSVMGQLTEEMSQSSNIKSAQTRKNVQGALRKISNFLKSINFSIPPNGLVVFCGNVSEREGRSDIRLFTIKPPRRLKVKLYWCDSEFHLDPLEEMIKPTDIYLIITMDKREATIALLLGKKYETVAHYTSGVAGKFRAGGQCLAENSLVQLSDGNIVEISQCTNPSSVKTARFGDFSVTDSFIYDKWEAVKPEKMIITTKYPQTRITCSKDHSLFCWCFDGIKEKHADELKVGDYLMMPERIKVKSKIQKLSNNCFNSFGLSEEGRKKIAELRKKNGFSQEQFSIKAGIFQATVSGIELGKFSPRFNMLEKICSLLGIDFTAFCRECCKPNSRITLPQFLDSELAQFTGYFLGDGSFEKERINLSEERQEISEKYCKLAKKLFNANLAVRFRKSKGYFSTRIYGKPIVKFFGVNFPELLLKEKSLPKKILKSENAVLAGFIRGLFDAEGYATKTRIAIGMNNEKLIKQLQMSLLRFGILSSVHIYDNRKNPYSDRERFTLQISEKKSLELFNEQIGFGSAEKAGKLKKLISASGNKSSMRQIIVPGTRIRRIIEDNGGKITDFPRVTNFFRNQRMMSRQTFQKSIISFVKNKKMLKELEKAAKSELLPAKIHKITIEKEPTKMIDISVDNQNFIANGLIVHNSAKRFEHLREEAAQDFYKRISEKINGLFAEHQEKIKGLIVGGPGPTKHYFLEKGLLDYRLKNKIIGIIDNSYTDESGIREIMQRSEEILHDTDLMRERTIINKFLEEVVKSGLAAYGQKEVEEALNIGKIATLILSEGIEWEVFKFECTHCGERFERIVKEPLNYNANAEKCPKCSSETELLEEIDYIDWMIEKAHKTSAEARVISTETSEGEQFYKGFGGIGALLRYR